MNVWRFRWPLTVALSAACLALGLSQAPSSTASPARSLVRTAASNAGGPGSATSLILPAACLSSTATHRIYPLNIPAGDTYARSGEHGHGKLTCIVFMTRTYSKVLVVDQAAGGYTIPVPGGLDVTYVDCVPPLRFPPNSIDNGPNDCADVGAATEGDWLFTSGQFAGQQMIPSATP